MTAEAPAAGRSATRELLAAFDALESRSFRYLWLNSFLFFIARGMQLLAISWLVLDLTDSPSLVGVALFAQGIPLALLSLPAGIWADRLDRRSILLAGHTLSVLLTAVLAALVLADAIAVWSIILLAFLLGSSMAIGQPSRQALVPSLVPGERLMNAIVLSNMVQNLSFVIGPAVAGGLIALAGFGGAFVAQVVVLAIGLPFLLALRAPAVQRTEERRSALTELREGLAHIIESPFIRSLFIVTAFSGIFFVGNFQALLPVFARDILDSGSVGLGFMNAAFGLGMLAGSLFIASRGNLERKGEALLRSLIIGGVIFLAFSASRWYPLSLVLLLAWGFGAAFFMNLTITLIQSHTPDRLMGRVMSVQALAFFGVSPIGNVEAGLLAEVLGAPAAAAIGAVAVGVMAAAMFLWQPNLREAT